MIELVHDGLRIRLKAWHDLSWLTEQGRLFCVFDQLISGNICFGLDNGREKIFIKYAGAPCLMYAGQPEAAVLRLREAEHRYSCLRHPALNPLKASFEAAGGHALVFPWFEGFALAPLDLHMRSLRSLPLIPKLAMYDQLMDFIVYAASRDYLAAGISDHHILIDFVNHRAIFSSVDHYMRFPAATPYPKLPGSSWYLPKEAYQAGTPLGEASIVYSLGALAFTLLSEIPFKKLRSWRAGEKLFNLACEAMARDPGMRTQSAAAYQASWRQEVLHLRGL